MSGICGAWAFEHDEPSLLPVLVSLEKRGPEGTFSWREGPVALGHTLLATTPEALTEKLPLTHNSSGCTITADARIDNRDELIATFNLGASGKELGDGALILHAYLEWGKDCPKHLIGDFAFAIWDPRANLLFCARDHIGMRQFSYHYQSGHWFVFATDPEAVVTHPHVPKRVNEGRIADFLDSLEGIDLTSTLFEEVYRLPPAHSLTVETSGISIERYWQLKAPPLRNDLDQDVYVAEFLSVFTEAVRCRLRSAGPVGSMVSGGLDSNSVSAVAAELLGREGVKLHTFSAIGPDPSACLETRTIEIATSTPGTERHFVNYAQLREYHSDLWRLWDEGNPFDSAMTLPRAVYLAASRSGVKVVLDGVAADFVLSSGNAIANLLRSGQIKKALDEARGEERYWGPIWPVSRAFLSSAWSVVIPRPIRKIRRVIAEKIRERNGHPVISREFADRIGLKRRRRLYRGHAKDEKLTNVDFRRRSILRPHNVAARERYDRVASGAGVEPRDPFLDIRLIEYCLTLPWTQLQAGGWPKLILRRAMVSLLPDKVIWRRGKEHLGWAFTRSFFETRPDWFFHLRNGAGGISNFAALPRVAPTGSADPDASQLENNIKLYSLLLWLKRNDKASKAD